MNLNAEALADRLACQHMTQTSAAFLQNTRHWRLWTGGSGINPEVARP